MTAVTSDHQLGYRKNSCHWTVKFSTTKYNQMFFTTVCFQLSSDSISTYIKHKYSSSKLFYLLRQIGRAKVFMSLGREQKGILVS